MQIEVKLSPLIKVCRDSQICLQVEISFKCKCFLQKGDNYSVFRASIVSSISKNGEKQSSGTKATYNSTSVQPRHRCYFHLFPIWFIDFFSFLCCSLSVLIFILLYQSNYINCRAFLLFMPTLTQCPYFTCSALVHDIS